MKYLIILITLIQLKIYVLKCQVISGSCGRPSVPPKVEMFPNDSNKYRFDKNDYVYIRCESNQFPVSGYHHLRQCKNGQWKGKKPKCAKRIDANVIQVQVYNCETNHTRDLLNRLIHLNKDGSVNIPNAYHSSRHSESISVTGANCYNWRILLNNNVKIARLQLEFYTLVKSDNDSKHLYTVYPNVGKYRTCHLNLNNLVTEKSKYTNVNNVISKWNYDCDINSYDDYINELNDLTSQIFVTINSTIKLDIGLEAVYIGEIYTVQNDSEPIRPDCGAIESPISTLEFKKEELYYEVKCNSSFYDLQQLTKHRIICDYNGQWSGEWPKCVPILSCPGLDKLKAEIDKSVEIEEIGNVYYYNETQWYAMNKTYVKYKCVNDNQILIGKSSRICEKNGQWSFKPPHCASTGVSTVAIVAILISSLTMMMIIVFIMFALFVRRMKKDLLKTFKEMEKSNQKRVSEYENNQINNSEAYENADSIKRHINYESISYEPILPPYETVHESCDRMNESNYLDMTLNNTNEYKEHMCDQ